MKRVDVTYAMLFDDTGEKILMVKNIGDPESYYTLPGGAVEPGETLQEAAVREVKEETGFDVKVDGIFSVNEAFFEKPQHHVVFFTFWGQITGGEIAISDPSEIEEVVWMPIDEAKQYMFISKELASFLDEKRSAPYFLRGKVK